MLTGAAGSIDVVPSANHDIPRIWEVDWAIPPTEGGTPWESYAWAFDTAQRLGVADISIVASTYEALGRLNWAIGSAEASRLRVQPHGYNVSGMTVHGISRRGYWRAHGVVLVAWASDQVLAEIEAQRPAAIAAVAQWPDDIAGWRSIHHPPRIGQTRAEVEAQFSTVAVTPLDPRVERTIDAAAAIVNENHSVLDTDERQLMAGAFIALRQAGIGVPSDALRTHLMTKGWNGKLIERAVELAERVAAGQTPKHRPFTAR